MKIFFYLKKILVKEKICKRESLKLKRKIKLTQIPTSIARTLPIDASDSFHFI